MNSELQWMCDVDEEVMMMIQKVFCPPAMCSWIASSIMKSSAAATSYELGRCPGTHSHVRITGPCKRLASLESSFN